MGHSPRVPAEEGTKSLQRTMNSMSVDVVVIDCGLLHAQGSSQQASVIICTSP